MAEIASKAHNHRNFTYLMDQSSYKGLALRQNLASLRSSLTQERLSVMLTHLLADKVVTSLEKEGLLRCSQQQPMPEVVTKFVTLFLLRKFESDFDKIVNAIRRAGLRDLATQLEVDARMPSEESEESGDEDFDYQENTASHLRQSAKCFFRDIYGSIGTDWKDVGIQLNLEFEDLKKIEVDQTTTDQRCFAMLHYWKETQPQNAYVGFLMNALISAGLGAIAERLDQLSNARLVSQINMSS
ncbi:hypothetical protein TrispH2_003511 [Trichoplax sp. H2]|nr:hypothetical protein TrispH2_003511 [Trichoplax sp. H2]|eukprot:RDD45580.1 hypothetical protein TrispH2_003511 [Trichoplax sp. H2]